MARRLLAAILLALAFGTFGAAASAPAADDLEILAGWMTGSFSSSAQAAADSNFLDIRLQMKPIWTGRDDGAWFYVEQAAAWALDKPYRQRVYHVMPMGDGRIASVVYELPDAAAAVGAWRLEAPLADLRPDDLVEREGCVVYLERRDDGVFVGGTHERDCLSTLRGATWASTVIEVRADRLVSWDRGWNDAGEQVWGSTAGGYVFLKD
jgi:CpeT protein